MVPNLSHPSVGEGVVDKYFHLRSNRDYHRLAQEEEEAVAVTAPVAARLVVQQAVGVVEEEGLDVIPSDFVTYLQQLERE